MVRELAWSRDEFGNWFGFRFGKACFQGSFRAGALYPGPKLMEPHQDGIYFHYEDNNDMQHSFCYSFTIQAAQDKLQTIHKCVFCRRSPVSSTETPLAINLYIDPLMSNLNCVTFLAARRFIRS